MKLIVPTLVGAFLLAGCVSSHGTNAIQAISGEAASRGQVTRVMLLNTPDNVSSGFVSEFQTSVMQRLSQCADGDLPLTLSVTLNGYQSANAALAFLAPAQSQISGVARLTDASGAVVGEYNIRRSLTVGGVVGAVAASNAEHHMSNAFGEELCKQAFKDR